MVEIKGLEKFAPKDYPGFISATVFLGGCNFRCSYCHNSELVLTPEKLANFPMDIFLGFLDFRKDWLEGICISGGEPLMDKNLIVLLRLLKERNLRVKIDTNGSYPDRLSSLIQAKLVDFVAMDVKAPIHKYADVVGIEADFETVVDCARPLLDSPIDSIFRTTAVPGVLGSEEIGQIGQWLEGAQTFLIQQFRPVNTIDPSFQKKKPFTQKELEELALAAKPYFSEVLIEGV